MAQRNQMIISRWWLQVAVITFAIGFGVLGYLAYSIYTEHPPIPQRVVTPDGQLLFTSDEILAGQHTFEMYGLMQYGSLFGHGAYLGPDFTTQYIHHATLAMRSFLAQSGAGPAEVDATILRESKANLYNRESKTLIFTPAQAHAFQRMVEFYRDYFGASAAQQGLKRPPIASADIRPLASYFAWAAWVATATRPGASYSYTNNWPPAPHVGNTPTANALLWSALSLIALLGGIGIIFFVFGRYNILGWHSAEDQGGPARLQFRPPDQVRLQPAQRATVWYFLVVAGLFLAQGLLGGANAHYHVEPASFYGLRVDEIFPYNLTRTWHLQLALFFVATSYLAVGIFLAPMIAGHEPRHQNVLAIALFAALVIVVVGSLAGEWLSYTNTFTRTGPWWWIGAQGWEYLDLGRLWQALLTAGMVIWLIILVRGLWRILPREHPGNMPYLFLYSALSIPLFYALGMVFTKTSSFAVVDFWRFWVVHLWVEDFLELFTTIMVAYIFVLIGVVRPTVATRVVYLDIILYSIGGVIGTMHHLYFSGAPAQHLALGAFFSAMEVVPLVLLSYEAYRFMRLGGAGPGETAIDTSPARFPHKWAVMFLIAVGFWNFLGAGVFGFLINLPVISYYEIGTQFTANHGHGAMMGVYGMLAIGFFMFVARYFIPMDRRSERAMKISFWSLNIGLAWMVFVNLVPIGAIQFYDAVQNGYFHARDPAFFQKPVIRFFEWMRLPGDVVFIVGGIFPIVYLAIRMVSERNRFGSLPPETPTEPLTESPQPAGSNP